MFNTKSKKFLFISVLSILVIVFFLDKRKNHVILVDAYVISKKEVLKTISSSGKTEPKKDYVIRSDVAAKIKELPFESGAQVKEGDAVVIFDEKDLLASAETAWAAYLKAKADFDSFDEQLNSANASVKDKLYARDKAMREYMGDNNFSNKQTFKTAEANYQSSLSALAILKAKEKYYEDNAGAAYSSYISAKDDLNNDVVKAPTDGNLALEDIFVGSVTTAGQKLFSITNFTGTEFDADVDEADIQSIQVGQKAMVSLEGYGDKFYGEIMRIDAKTHTTSSDSTVVTAAVKFSSGPANIQPIIGMTGTAEIEVGKATDALAIPFDSILFEGEDKNYVFVIKNGKVEKRQIMLGFEGTDFYVVKDGLLEGEQVVAGEVISKLKNGDKVSLNKNK